MDSTSVPAYTKGWSRMKFDPDSVLRSAVRVGEICRKIKESPDPEPGLFLILKRESTYLVRRAIRFWFSLRPWREIWKKGNTK